MILSAILPKSGPIWAESIALCLDKSIAYSAMTAITKFDQIKKVHDEFIGKTQNDNTSNMEVPEVIDVFNDANK